jgi:hypothetical protein
MFHLEANSLAAAQNVETDLTPVPSPQLAVFNGHWFPQDQPSLIFAAAMSTNITRARIQTPTLNLITTPFIRGIMGGLIPTTPGQVSNWVPQPLALKAREEVIVFGVQSAVASTRITVLLGMLFGQVPPATGTQYTMRGTSVTAAVANAWTLLTVTWQNQLPQGNYAATGLQHQSANAQAARFIFLGQYYRPGCMSLANLIDFGHPIFRLGYLGQWGTWRDNIMPNVEVLCNAADAAHELYLDFMKL